MACLIYSGHSINQSYFRQVFKIFVEKAYFFNFDIDEFDQDDLLIYTPEYVYFRDEDITIFLYSDI